MNLQITEQSKKYTEEIREYLVGRLVTKHYTDGLNRDVFAEIQKPVLPWWIFEGNRYKGYSEPLYKCWDQINRQIDFLLSTYNPKWQGILLPEGEIDWVATAFKTVTSIVPEFVCRTSKIGLSEEEKTALFGWMKWISELWANYLYALNLDYKPAELFKVYIDSSYDLIEVKSRNLIKWASTAKRSRWPLMRNVVAESMRCAFEPVYINKLPLPETRSEIFELLCMVRILKAINSKPAVISWVDTKAGNNECCIPGAVYHYQYSFKPLHSSEFSYELSDAVEQQKVKIPKFADGYLKFDTRFNGFSGVLVEAKSGQNRETGETIYQLKSLLAAIRKEMNGERFLILGIVENSDKDNNLKEYTEFLSNKYAHSENDVWCFLKADEIEAFIKTLLLNNPREMLKDF